MYLCHHCKDRHFAADQARNCAEVGDDWIPGAVEEVLRQAERGPVSWWYKMTIRKQQQKWTTSERALWRALKRVLPRGALRYQWWISGCGYRVDFVIPSVRLVIEVDGSSHDGRDGADRLRSMDIGDLNYEIARATVEDVMRDADR